MQVFSYTILYKYGKRTCKNFFKTCTVRVFIGLAIMQEFIYTRLYKYGKRTCKNFFGILIVIVL